MTPASRLSDLSGVDLASFQSAYPASRASEREGATRKDGLATGRKEKTVKSTSDRHTSIDDILWSIPEQKTGILQVIGGNKQSFSTEIRTVESLNTLPLKEVRLALPDALKSQLPPTPKITFYPSTPSGSFAKSPILTHAFDSADFNLVLGDLSKNSATAIALSDAITNSKKPTLITRDAIDLLAPEAQTLLLRENLIIFATLPQLQKLFRSALYPKMLLLSMPLNPILDTLHKFTLSYPVTIITFNNGQLIFAHHGETKTLPLEKTSYSVLSLWTGTLAGKISAINLWTPNHPLNASLAAFNYNK